MNADKNEEEKLPDGWVLCRSKSNPGRKYFFNKKTGKSSWTQPQADQKEFMQRTKIHKKKEDQRNCLKRKSDTYEESSTRKRTKQETCTPEKLSSPVAKRSPIKQPDSSKTKSPLSQTPLKNSASSRLSQLRSKLSFEAQEEEAKLKTIPKQSPKTPQTEIKKPDLKSPTFNDSKCSTTSPNDSVQSTPSPSQFFAANKILSSMKAQLPEEYCNKLKPKDSFADIEERITKQMPEYSSMKHPATPPQFSEASKLVSAIKSKLSYKASPRDFNVKVFPSAKDRLESLRTSLTSEADTSTTEDDSSILSKTEISMDSMDVDESKEETTILEIPIPIPNAITSSPVRVEGTKDDLVLVVDTNIFIHELNMIKNVLNSHIKGYTGQPTLLVPWRVVSELDRLKDNNNGAGAVCKRARAAMDYLYQSLPENDRIRGQSLRDANSHIYPCESPDDEILNCCLQQADRGNSVILFSNDKNLCNKAMMNSVKCVGLAELRSLLRAPPAADPGLYEELKNTENNVYHLLANILENEMRAKYNNLWQHVVFLAPPWALRDVLASLLKHWVAVFQDVFPRIEPLLIDLKDTFTALDSKDPKALTKSEVSNFKELCLEVSRKCQIIPEYMELAKLTVERLSNKSTQSMEPKKGEMVVIDVFEQLWTVYSSYCAKLSTSLGVPHTLEDNCPSATLTPRWPTFCNQIHELAIALRGALSPTPNGEESLLALETVLKESMVVLAMDAAALRADQLRAFCANCRNLLEEAHTKFAGLSELLNRCQLSVANDE